MLKLIVTITILIIVLISLIFRERKISRLVNTFTDTLDVTKRNSQYAREALAKQWAIQRSRAGKNEKIHNIEEEPMLIEMEKAIKMQKAMIESLENRRWYRYPGTFVKSFLKIIESSKAKNASHLYPQKH